jgi:RimJ/RimL family protein N-acetyltransferase
MRHDLSICGEAFRLRPVQPDDAAFIVDLRSDRERTKFLHPISGLIEDQKAYLDQYFRRHDDYYFIVDSLLDGKPQGTISIYNIDREKWSGEFGRWILTPGSLAAVESALLLYTIAFNALKLEMVFTRTIASNDKVVSFHQSCGLKTQEVLRSHIEIDGESYDAVEQRLTLDAWPEVEPRLAEKAAMTARMVRRCSRPA